MNGKGLPLSELLGTVPHSSATGPASAVVRDLTCDSREVKEGFCFFALKGFKRDGREFADEAIERGARVVFSHAGPLKPVPKTVTWVVCPRDREAFSAAAAALYDTQASKVKVVGVTGTNGKTTIAYLLRSILGGAGGAGLLGTVEYDDGKGLRPAVRTTPEAHEVHRWIRTIQKNGAAYGVMEVSSHSLVLARVKDVPFAVAAFTNLTRDHLDFHKTMEAYYQAKRSLLDLLSPSGIAVINLEDPYGLRLSGEVDRKRLLSVGRAKPAQVRPKRYEMDLKGIRGTFLTPFGDVKVRSGLTGEFNVQNLLMAAASALAAGATIQQVEEGVAALEIVPGRMERVDAGQPFVVLVDYAHTDDALKNLLQTVRDLKPRRVITVFGCGGDRDRTKRPLMGAVAARLSDVLFLTSDNPRTEDPAAIARDVEKGIKPELNEHRTYRCILDRRRAMADALSAATEGDVVVVAGKGHERDQQTGEVKRPFHDPTVLRELLGEMGWR
jgi:UDP-N-acetylmuramoyl-L-alanyl-D-glutamate--2,6-diaminopimelate ligase